MRNAGQSNEEVMRQVYALHARALHSYITKRVDGDSHLAEDLTQETFLRASSHLEITSAEVADLRPWLVTVARRLIIDTYRKRATRPSEQSLELAAHDVAACNDQSDNIIQMLVLKEVFGILNPAQQEALFSTHFYGYSSSESAGLLGVSPGTVRSRTFYALRSLREALADT
ncbi:sigma-70 family RNA polymerase sigma factor [Streptomyces sp. NPDC059688]|uniref:sigma-70 family RNA polymerase sigma factor n=1 Tax=Streptomyces sp. NPDC059688 TaxID=3346906 RepID=UPI0036893E93